MAWWIHVREYADHRAMARGDAPIKEYDAIDDHTGLRREWVAKHQADYIAENWRAAELRPITYQVQ